MSHKIINRQEGFPLCQQSLLFFVLIDRFISSCQAFDVALLRFAKHVDSICVKASRQLNALIRIKKKLNRKEKLLLFQSFILSNFNYCPLMWHCVNWKSVRKMERIQERALRFVLNDNCASYEQLLTDSGISSLHLCRVRASAVEVYKCLNGINPAFMCKHFTKRDSEYNIRDHRALFHKT